MHDASTETNLALQPNELSIVQDILSRHIPQHIVLVYGSRVQGRAKQFSDLDLAVCGSQPLSFSERANLEEAFSESDLPFTVDIIDWCDLDNSFKKRVLQQHVLLRGGDLSKLNI